MSQMGKFSGGLLGIPINFITGNAGGPISPDVFSNIFLLGTDPITVTGTPATWTLDITVANASETQIGVLELATDVEAVAGVDTTRAIVPSSLLAKLGAMTANSIPYGAGTAAALSWLPVGTTNTVLLGNTGAAPTWGQVDLATDVTGILPVPNGGTGVNAILDHGVVLGSGVAAVSVTAVGATNTVLLGNTGADPTFGQVPNAALVNDSITINNGNNITVTGSPVALGGVASIDLTGTTQFAVQVGDATGSLDSLAVGATNTVLLGNTGANPTWGQVDLTTDVTGILPVPNGGTGVNTILNHSLVIGAGVAAITSLGVAGDGVLPIGSAGLDPVLGNITSTEDLTITNGAGTISIDFTADTNLTAIHGWNGSFIETTDVTVAAAGGVITLSIEQEGGGNLTAVFSDGFYTYVTAPDTVTLTAGTDIAPTLNYVYLLQTTKILTASTVGWPATEFCAVAEVLCQSAASLQANGAYKVHVWTDHIVSPSDQGHISMLSRWVRQQNATWQSGVAPTLTITPQGGAADNVIFTSSAGIVYQLHAHTFPLFGGTPDVYTVNDFTTPYNIVTDLNALLTDSANVSMSGRYFSLVIWGVQSEDGADCKLMVNLPGGSYNTQTQLLADSSKFTNFSMPANFKGTGFLIYQMNLRHQVAASGTWTSISNIDLRGLEPSIAAGGSTAFATEFADNVFRIFDDGDNTKELAFECSAITTATTRTITMDDRDIDMDAVATTVATDAGNGVPAAGTLTIAGGTNIATSGAGSTATINFDGTLPVGSGGSGDTTFTDHGVLLGSGAGAFSVTAEGATNTVLHGNTGADPTYSAVDMAADVTGILPVPNGGTGLNTLTDGGLLLGSGVGAITPLAQATHGQLPIGSTGADCVLATLTAGANIGIVNAAGTITISSTGGGPEFADNLFRVYDNAVNTKKLAFECSTITAATTRTLTMCDQDLSLVTPTFPGLVTASAALTVTTGDLTISAANLNLPTTTAALTAGVIEINSVRVFHTYGTNNTFVGAGSGNGTMTGQANVGVGSGVLDALTTGHNNVAVGRDSCTVLQDGIYNCAIGSEALFSCTSGGRNMAIGLVAMRSITSGSYNTAIGVGALDVLTTGNYNLCFGTDAGNALVTNDSDNICISNSGVATDNNTIRLGTHGAGDKQQNLCFIAGIRGVTTGTSDAIAVLIASDHQLGTASSTIRAKQNVNDMGSESSPVMNLRPVTFEYKQHPGIKQYGLIAEEVVEHLPRLVVNDEEGLPQTIKYHELPAIMLNEMKKMKNEIVTLRKELSELRSEYGNKS